MDVLESVSRVMIDVVDEEQKKAAARVREILAVYRESEDLINIGAYVKGSNPRIDSAIAKIEPIRGFLRQGIEDRTRFDETLRNLGSLLN